MKVNIGNREDKKLITDIAPGTCFLNRNDEGGMIYVFVLGQSELLVANQ